MAEEIVKEEVIPEVPVDETVETPEVIQTPEEPTEIELEAMQEGWTPKDQWTGDPKQWRDAATWIDRGQMIRTITSLRGEIRKLEPQVAHAFKQATEITEAKYKADLEELRAIRRKALEEQDFATADKLEDRIDDLKENKTRAVAPAKVADVPPEYNVFTTRNPKYLSDSLFQHTANAIGADFIAKNKSASPADLYWHVENEMKKGFPHYYGGKTVDTKNKPLPATESGGNGKGGESSSADTSGIKKTMSEMDLSIMKTYVKQGVFKNEAEYLAEYAKLNK